MEVFIISDLYNSIDKKKNVIHLQWYCLKEYVSAFISLYQVEKGLF